MSADTPHTPPDRRARKRVPHKLDVVVKCDTGLTLPGHTVELSEQGVRIRLQSPLRNHREHTPQSIDINEIGILSVDLRWVADTDVGLALTGDWVEQEMMTMYLSHLEGHARAAQAAKSRANER